MVPKCPTGLLLFSTFEENKTTLNLYNPSMNLSWHSHFCQWYKTKVQFIKCLCQELWPKREYMYVDSRWKVSLKTGCRRWNHEAILLFHSIPFQTCSNSPRYSIFQRDEVLYWRQVSYERVWSKVCSLCRYINFDLLEVQCCFSNEYHLLRDLLPIYYR